MGAVESCCGSPDARKSVDRSSSTNTSTESKKPIEEKSDPITSKPTPTPPRREKDEIDKTPPPPEEEKKKKEEISSSPSHEENTPPPPPEEKKKEEPKKQAPPVPERTTEKSLNKAKASVSSKEQEKIDEVSEMLSHIELFHKDLTHKPNIVPAVVKKINTKKKAEERRKALDLSNEPGDSPHEAEVLIFICGDGGVGKTCVASSFTQCGYFPGEYVPTHFDTKDVYCKFIINGKPVRFKLRILDTAGQEGLFNKTFEIAKASVDDFLNDKTCEKKGVVFFLCYSTSGITEAEKKYARSSFKNTGYDPDPVDKTNYDSWVSSIERFAKDEDDKLRCESTSIMLVGTKDDACDDTQRVVKEVEAKEQCKLLKDDLEGGYKIEHGYCSALFYPESVKKLFSQAVSLSLK